MRSERSLLAFNQDLPHADDDLFCGFAAVLVFKGNVVRSDCDEGALVERPFEVYLNLVIPA